MMPGVRALGRRTHGTYRAETMANNMVPTRLQELVHLMDVMHKLHGKLLKLADAKLDAVRKADVGRLGELLAQEAVSLTRLRARHQDRQRILGALCGELGVGSRCVKDVALSQLIAHLAPEEQSRLQGAAARWREMSARLAKANRMVGAVTRELLGHLTWVFASVRPETDEVTHYSPRGLARGSVATGILETVG